MSYKVNDTTIIDDSRNILNAVTVSVGANVVANSSSLRIGNSTVNTAISSGNIAINGQNISPTMSFRNVLINGNFNFWQRGTSLSAGGYLADRWNVGIVGSTVVQSRQAFTIGQTDVPNNPTYWHRTVVTSVAGAGNRVNLVQPIERVSTLAGQTVTFSFYAKADASKNIAVEFAQNFGTGGSPSTQVNSIGVTTCALTTSWAKHTVTATLPSISGKTLGTDGNDFLGILFWFDAGSTFNSRTNSLGQQSGTFDIAQVQLEQGSVATPFELRPLAAEEVMCYRYYQTIYVNAYATSASFGSYAPDFYYPMSFNTPMRAAPTLTRTGVTDSGVTGAAFATSRNGFTVSMELTAATGQSVFTATASAEL